MTRGGAEVAFTHSPGQYPVTEHDQEIHHGARRRELAEPGKNARRFLPGWSRREGLSALALIVAVFAVYLPVWNAGFVWDDTFYLQESPNISGLRGLMAIWTTGSADISPFMLTTLWVEHALWGFEPLPYHLVNLVLHGACAV